MRDFLASSSNDLLAEMAEEKTYNETTMASPVKTPRLTSSSSMKLKEDSISKQFSASLRTLYKTLDATAPFFVRCIKPNERKVPDCFMAQEVLTQLQYCGMLETIKYHSCLHRSL